MLRKIIVLIITIRDIYCHAAVSRRVTGANAKTYRKARRHYLTVRFGRAWVDLVGSAMAPPMNADGIKWSDIPPVFPQGAQMTVISGDPSKDGLYVVRLKMPANYKILAHNHPTTEYVTVLSGSFHVGMGDKLDETKGQELKAGGFVEALAKMSHYGWTTSETIVQVHGQGPFAITYVNAADDPSKQQ